MTSLSNKFCERATDAALAKIIPVASIRISRRRNGEPPLEEMCRQDVNDGGNHENEKQW
jgi:hypothetical protein